MAMKKAFPNKQKSGQNLNLEHLKERQAGDVDSMAFLDQENIDGMDAYLESMGIKNPQKERQQKSQESTIFNYSSHQEKEGMRREIAELTEHIKSELVMIKKTNQSISTEVKDIEKVSMEYSNEKQGIYHMRFLETILSILKVMRSKVGEAKTWLTAINNRRKSRGFTALSKSKGTQYSLSSELQVTRNSQ